MSRELRRNTARHDRGGYEPVLAHARARARTARPGRSRLSVDRGLCEVVQAKLDLEWSPEQIAAHLRAVFAGKPSWHVCHETIYQALYKGLQGWVVQDTDEAAAHRPPAAQASSSPR